MTLIIQTARPVRVLLTFLLVAVLSLCSSSSYSADLPSVKKSSEPPEVILANKAEVLLDQWRGQTSLLDQAEEYLHLALEKNPNYAKTYMLLGRFHIMAGYYHSRYFEPSSLAASEKAIKKAIELDAEFADAYVLLGHLYTNMHRMSEAKAALQTAEKIGTDNPWLELNWADIHEMEKNFDEAAQKYIKVINSKTKNLKALGAAHDKLRRYYIHKRDLVKAEEIYKANIALEPENAWARGNYASNLLYMVGDFDKAIEKAREALSIMEYGNAQQTLALALYGKWATMVVKNRNKAGAKAYFDEAQRIYPDLAELKQEASQYPTTRIIVEALASVQK